MVTPLTPESLNTSKFCEPFSTHLTLVDPHVKGLCWKNEEVFGLTFPLHAQPPQTHEWMNHLKLCVVLHELCFPTQRSRRWIWSSETPVTSCAFCTHDRLPSHISAVSVSHNLHQGLFHSTSHSGTCSQPSATSSCVCFEQT